MKKSITTLLLLTTMIAFRSQAQLVPNAGLEVWNNILGLYDEPDKWATPNPLTSVAGVITVKKSTESLDGTYAARLQSTFVLALGATVPGAMGTGTLDVATQTFKGGFPLNGNIPAALIGYFKYFPVNGDSCLIVSFMSHWDAVNNKRDTVALAIFAYGDSAANYIPFTAPVIPLMPGTNPDSAIVIVSSSNSILTAQDGTVMFVDDIDLSNAVGVEEINPVSLSIYPNPADASFEVNLPAELNANTMMVVSMAGTTMTQFKVSSGSNIINTKSLADGVYLCLIKNQGGKVAATAKFTVLH